MGKSESEMRKSESENNENENIEDLGCLGKVSYAITGSLESFFYRYGVTVASHQVISILICTFVTIICCMGFANFYMESRPEKLWIPQDSDYVKTLEWQKENFPNDQRLEMILYEADNVLTAQYVQEMYRLRKEVRAIQITDKYGQNLTQEDMCYRVPALGGRQQDELRRLKLQLFPDRDPDAPFDWSLAFDKSIYNEFYIMMPTACLELSILEIWGDNDTVIAELTDDKVIEGVNTATISATYGYPLNYSVFLGAVERDASGWIEKAGSAITQIFMEVNRTDVEVSGLNNDAGLASEVDEALYDWEGEFIKLLRDNTGRPEGLGVYLQAERSFGEVSGETILGDVAFLVIGILMLFVYVQIMLGKFNLVETRPVLSILGLLSVFMAVGISYGLCSALGIPYGPVHSILPLLLLGLGVDDMFVIVQCFHNLTPKEQQERLQKRMGRTLRHAGVAITITSLTDFVAFTIGSTTVLPALQSFCIYAAVGIIALYLLQATFFFAWFAVDQRRLEDHRNGLFWCYKHKNWTPNSCSQKELCQLFFDRIYSKILLTTPAKIAVLVLTGGMLGAGIWGVTNLRQEFNPVWFIPQSSYLYQFISRAQQYYPQAGERGIVYLGALDYPQEVYMVGELCDDMRANQYILNVDCWYDQMANYINASSGEDITGKPLNESFFSKSLSEFLFSPDGSRYQNFFHFDSNLTIGLPAPTVIASKFNYRHTSLDGRDEQIAAMDQLKEIVNDVEFSDFAAPIAMMYSSWETDKIIAHELVRNLSLAMLAVLIMTLLLLANVLASLYVLLCVVLTLIDVMALMTWWDLTIDTVSCINLVVIVGLCVDYSVHIALHFLQVKGTRNDRVKATIREMGPAVINGAFSTFLALILLASSDSHVFTSFFKIFFGVFIFGVFHGLVFLPVLLSFIGPKPYPSAKEVTDHSLKLVPVPHQRLSLSTKDIEISGVSYEQVQSMATSTGS